MMTRQASNSRLLSLALGLLFLFSGPARAEMQDYQSVKLQALDKVTARTLTFEAKVGSTVKYGPLYIRIQACRKAPPIERPESAAFLQIWEVLPDESANWVFSGWMFASSPALSPMDHSVYDVWVLDCTGEPPMEDAPIAGGSAPVPGATTEEPNQEENAEVQTGEDGGVTDDMIEKEALTAP